MITILAWIIFIVALPLNLIFWSVILSLKSKGHAITALPPSKGKDILYFVIMHVALFVPGIYLFGVW